MNDVTKPLTGEQVDVQPKGISSVRGTTFPYLFYGVTFHDVHTAAALNQPTSPKGYLRAAKEFLHAFAGLPPDVPFTPRVYLAAQALECTLKAYIARHDPERLKAALGARQGHDIIALLGAASQASNVATSKLSMDPSTPPEWVRTLAAFHGSPFLDRYPIDVGMVVSIPSHEDLTDRLRGVLAEVDAAFQ